MCKTWRHEFVMPEHLLYILYENGHLSYSFCLVEQDEKQFATELEEYLHTIETVPEDVDYTPEASSQLIKLLEEAANNAYYAMKDTVDIAHVVTEMFTLDDSMAAYLLNKYVGDMKGSFIHGLLLLDDEDEATGYNPFYDEDDENDDTPQFDNAPRKETWRELVTCLNDTYGSHNPLIGRAAELERTIQVLCRKEKNNPLHVGEAGVGKTAIVYGLTAMIERGDVPERLRGAKVYMMDMGSMVAGTQFRGDFEKRIKIVMQGLAKEKNAILYIDEIHNIVGAGRNGDGSLDASNMIKPYLEDGSIRFIGSTTYDEYNRHIAQHKSLVRRFQQIDIAEPSIEEAIDIIKGLLSGYEQYHGVEYSEDAVDYAVRSSARYLTDRFLPDKAIDIIDEAGAYRETHPIDGQERQVVGRKLLADILAKICKIDAAVLKDQSNDSLATLADDIKAQIYGQDKAVEKVVEAVQMAKAGLADDTKPMASLLFVGPTGVGKTEVAKVLAERLGVNLVRFDMSEYAEKHTVAKLIGSPAGYVGYEDGGLLTAAIRKSPNCVLLFDEIEKAHPDIYNIFLQMMDYASLTDSRGQKADFRNVVIIMTSNAGAQYASHASIGFGGGVPRGEAMLTQVKKTFKPEFINRLSDIVVFADLSRDMATRILDKCLGELRQKLDSKKVALVMADEAKAWLLDKGFSAEYGARQLERVVNAELKPMLMRAILFGKLARGGEARVTLDGDKLLLEC